MDRSPVSGSSVGSPRSPGTPDGMAQAGSSSSSTDLTGGATGKPRLPSTGATGAAAAAAAPRTQLSQSSSSILRAPSTPADSDAAKKIEELEKALEMQLRLRSGAENMLKLKTKKSEKAQVMTMLEEYSMSVEKIRGEIARLNKRVARYDCGHLLSDLVDMVDAMNLSPEAIQERIAFLRDKIQKEQKLKAGAENLARNYGAGNVDQKLVQEVFLQLKECNNKLSLLKVALDKYTNRLEADSSLLSPLEKAVSTPDKLVGSEHAKGEEETLYRAKKVAVTGKLKLKIVGARNLASPHRKLDVRVLIKVDAVVRAKTSTKANTNTPEWNEDLEMVLDGATELEIQLFNREDLYTILYFDIKALVADPPLEGDQTLVMEPRGELLVNIIFVPKSNQIINRRGAVKKRKLPMAMVRFLGFKKTDEIVNNLQKESTMRKRETRQRDMPAAGAVASPSRDGLDSKSMIKVRPPRLEDFTLIRVLGRGNFGKVMLVEEINTKKMFAIKVLKKDFIVENDEVESVKSEKRVFQVTNEGSHPFMVKLHSCFQSKDRIFFVMEYVSGGDLMMHIQRQVFSEQRAKLYAAEVLLALEHLHAHDIVYRDLKLDNILMDMDGHIKVADYGLCKENMGWRRTTNTFCGTPEFMAPEILLERDYTRAVDWWAFGVLIYEMILAQSPFKGGAEEEIFEAILESEIHFPSRLHPTARNLLEKLLERDPAKRLGGGPRDSLDVKEHPYFQGIDWAALLRKEVDVTYRPQLKDARDTTNFDPEFTREPAQITPTETSLTAADQEEFRGFSYVAEWTVKKESAV